MYEDFVKGVVVKNHFYSDLTYFHVKGNFIFVRKIDDLKSSVINKLQDAF